MRELIKGVTKIRWAGKENPPVPYSLWKHKEGVYAGQNKGVYSWVSPSGVEFQYGVYKTLFGDEGIDHEFADDGEVPKLKVGDLVTLIRDEGNNIGGVVKIDVSGKYCVEVDWGLWGVGYYSTDQLVVIDKVSEPVATEESQSITKLKEDIKITHETLGAKVKSTGSSSDYYKIVLPEWLMLKQKDNGFIMLEDLAEIMFDNDFNYVNVMKAQKRMFDLEGGRGKEGNTFEYDATKCKYYIDKQVEVFNREQEGK